MDKLKGLTHTSSNKEDIKAHYQITLKKIDGLPKTWSNPLYISWKRGNKKENAGETKSIPKEGTATIEHTISMDSTITKTNKGYQAKSLLITLKEEIKSLGPGKKPVQLGTCEINLAQYVESKTEKSNLFQIKDKSKPICNLYVTIQSNWLKINGKSLVKVDNPQQKEIIQELGKQQIQREGSDYFLQTEQDMSEPDQTDFGNDGHESDGEDDDVSFEDDSSSATNSSVTTTTTTSTLNQQPPLLSRKSSDLSDRDLSSTSLNELKSPLHSTSTTGKSKTTGTLDDTKLKKYKKKLKSLKLEIEKLKTEKEESKKMYDEMEKIVDRTKQVGDHHTSEYLGKIELLTKNNKDLESQLQNLRSQSTKDSNEIINLQNQIISLGSQLDSINQENSTLNDNLRVLEDKVLLQNTNGVKKEEEEEEDDNEIVEQLQSELVQSKSQIEQLNFELVQAKGTLQQAQEENRNQFMQLEQERLKSNSNESNASRVSQENSNLKQQIEHSEKTIHLQIDEFEKEKLILSNEIHILKEKITEQDKQINNSNSNSNNEVILGEMELEIKNLLSQLTDKDKEIELMNQSYEFKVKEIEDAKLKEIEILRNSIDEKDQIIQNNQFELLKIKDELGEKLKIELEKDIEIEKLREDLININNINNNNSSVGDASEAEITKLHKQLEELENRLREVEQEKENEIDRVKQEVSDELRKVQEISEEKDKEIEMLKNQQEKQESDSSSHTDQLLDEKDEEILELKMKFENEKIDLQNEISKLQLSEHENSKLKSQILEYQMDTNSKQNILNEYQALISKLQIELDESNSKKDDLNQQLLIVKNDLEEQKHINENNNNNDNNNNNNNSDESDSDSKSKLKKLKNKIKKLKEEMEDKDDEWIDAKIKYEDTIQDLQLNLKDLQANVSLVPVILDTHNENDEHERHLQELRNQLDKSNNELEKEKTRSQSLETEIQQLLIEQSKYSSSTPVIVQSSTPSSPNMLDSVDDIKKELEENKNIESSIYWPEIDYDRNNVPYCGGSVWSLIHSIGGISQPQNQRLLGKIIISLEKSFLRSGNDCKFICYWLGTVSFLLHKLHQVGLIQEQADPTKSGIEISISSFIQPSAEHGGTFVRDLQALLLNIYSKLIAIIEIRIEKVLIGSIFLPESLILTGGNTGSGGNTPIKNFSPLNHYKPNSTPSTPLAKSSATSNTTHHINNLLSILDNVIQFIKESKISDTIGNQLLNQTFYFINSQITNYLLTNPKVCTSTQGLEVKMGVSRLKEWCSQTNFKSASQQLDSSHEASNLLVIDKNVFVDVEAIKSIFSKLNLHQIRVLLESYAPDDLSPEPLPQTLKKAMDNNWRQPIDINNLPLQIDSSKKIKSLK